MIRNWKGMAIEQVLRPFVSLVARASEKDIERLSIIAERLAFSERDKKVIRGIRRHWQQGTPGAQLLRRGFRETDRKCRTRIIHNLMLSSPWGVAATRRDEFFRREGFYPPFTLLFSPTMRCNLRCEGCYAGSYSQEDDLSFETVDRLLGEADELGIHVVTVLGGEPLLRKDLLELYEKYRDIVFMIFTNGTMIDGELTGKMLSLANIVPVLSIDGMEEEMDSRRGKGSFRRVVRAMDLLRQAGIVFGFSSMVTSRNLATVIGDEFVDLLVDKGCIFGWHFLYIPVGRNPDMDLMPTPEQRETLRREGAARIRRTKPLFVMDFWNDAPYVGGCIAGGRSYIHVNSRGDVEPCIFAHFAVDNIKRSSLREALRAPYLAAIRSRQPFDSNLLRPCMLIDHPSVFREIHSRHDPYPTHAGAESLVGGLAACMDRYAEEAGAILDRAWETDFPEEKKTIFSDTPARSPHSHGREISPLPLKS